MAHPPRLSPALTLGRFRRAATHQFAVTAEFEHQVRFVREAGVARLRSELPIVMTAMIGISCPPAESLLEAAGASRPHTSLERALEEGAAGTQAKSVAVARAEQIPAAVTTLTAAVTEHGMRRAAVCADLDAFVRGLRARQHDRDGEREQVPAVLAAGGRAGDARRALAEYVAGALGARSADEDYLLFADRLGRLLDAA